jgi:uncharacterized membrane protein YgcG
MEIVLIIGLAIAFVVLMIFFIRERISNSGNLREIENLGRTILNLKTQVSHHKHHSETFQAKFNDAENKIKALGFTDFDDIQLNDSLSIVKISKARESLQKDAQKRHEEARKKKLAEDAERKRKIKELADAERHRLAVIESKRTAERQAKKYRNNGSYDTDSSGLMSFIPAMGAASYADSSSGYSHGGYSDGGFSSSGGSFSSDSGSSSGGGGGD